jgi:hypothetical protein
MINNISYEKKVRLWKLLKKVAYLNQTHMPDYVYDEFNDCMKTIEVKNELKYILVEHYNLDTTFTFKAFEESDFKSKKETDRLKEMFEDFFNDDKKEWSTILMINFKSMRAYYLTKEVKGDSIKYKKKSI